MADDAASSLIGKLFVPVLELTDLLDEVTDEKDAFRVFGCDNDGHWRKVKMCLDELDTESLKGADLVKAVDTINRIRTGTDIRCRTYPQVASYLFNRKKSLRKAATLGWDAAANNGVVPDDPFPLVDGLLRDNDEGMSASVERAEPERMPIGISRLQVYERLLIEFRQAHSSQKDWSILLQLFDEEAFQTQEWIRPNPMFYSDSKVLEQKLAPVGEKWNPWCDSYRVVCIPYSPYFPAKGNQVDRETRHQESLESWNVFSNLGAEAGAQIPIEFRDLIPGSGESPLANWLQLMFVTLREQVDLDSARHGCCNLSHVPFSDAADVIEICQLHTDSPVLPPVLQERKCRIDAIPEVVTNQGGKLPVRQKKSTRKGEAELKLKSALTNWHKYENRICSNLDPIASNELARRAKVSKASASEFFKKHFQGYDKYRVQCQAKKVGEALAILNNELRPSILNTALPSDRRGECSVEGPE